MFGLATHEMTYFMLTSVLVSTGGWRKASVGSPTPFTRNSWLSGDDLAHTDLTPVFRPLREVRVGAADAPGSSPGAAPRADPAPPVWDPSSWWIVTARLWRSCRGGGRYCDVAPNDLLVYPRDDVEDTDVPLREQVERPWSFGTAPGHESRTHSRGVALAELRQRPPRRRPTGSSGSRRRAAPRWPRRGRRETIRPRCPSRLRARSLPKQRCRRSRGDVGPHTTRGPS